MPSEDRGAADCGTGKTRERNKEPDLIEANVFWEPWENGSLDGRRREGRDSFTTGIPVERRQGRNELRSELHDATNALLSMKHDVDKQAANQMRSRMRTKVFVTNVFPWQL